MTDGPEKFVQQSTHWYRSGWGQGRYGYTANPYCADEGEIERVGLHECFALGCEIEHTGNGNFWRRILEIREVQAAHAGGAQGGHRSAGVQGLPER